MNNNQETIDAEFVSPYSDDEKTKERINNNIDIGIGCGCLITIVLIGLTFLIMNIWLIFTHPIGWTIGVVVVFLKIFKIILNSISE